MDRLQLVLLGLPLILFASDLVHIFTPPPPRGPNHHHDHHHRHRPTGSVPINSGDDSVFLEKPHVGGIGYGDTVEIKFCASCSYRGTALTMKKMLENSLPGVEIILSNYPPALPKWLLGKVVPVVQVGFIVLITAGEQIFPRLGFAAPPPWYFTIRANRFGAIATTWLFGNFAQSSLQSSGAFEVYCNGDMVFSKLMENRFPSELELRDLVRRRLAPLSSLE